MSNIHFTHEKIKGDIAEEIFWQMFRELGKFTILRFGYEYSLPELAQYQYLPAVKAVQDNIRNAPDFLLISQDRKEVYLVEVKYHRHLGSGFTLSDARKTYEHWDSAWLFIATLDGFYFGRCQEIIQNHGAIRPLDDKWVLPECREQYLDLLIDYEEQHAHR